MHIVLFSVDYRPLYFRPLLNVCARTRGKFLEKFVRRSMSVLLSSDKINESLAIKQYLVYCSSCSTFLSAQHISRVKVFSVVCCVRASGLTRVKYLLWSSRLLKKKKMIGLLKRLSEANFFSLFDKRLPVMFLAFWKAHFAIIQEEIFHHPHPLNQRLVSI